MGLLEQRISQLEEQLREQQAANERKDAELAAFTRRSSQIDPPRSLLRLVLVLLLGGVLACSLTFAVVRGPALCTAQSDASLDLSQRLVGIARTNASTPSPALDLATAVEDPACAAVGITAELIAKSRTNLGNTLRWQRVLQSREDIAVAVLGGSVTAGHQCNRSQNIPDLNCAWPSRFEKLLSALGHARITKVTNLGRGATPSSIGAEAVLRLGAFDVILINWTANDDNYKRFYQNDPSRILRAFESLVRTALALPKRPAVIIFEDVGLHRPEPVAEQMHGRVAFAYDLPVISARAATWNHVWSGRKEQLSLRVGPHQNQDWHQKYACLLFGNWVTESKSTFNMSDFSTDVKPIWGGYTLRCQKYISLSAHANSLKLAPAHVDGWSYFADRPGKYGFISTGSGSSITFSIVVPQTDLHNWINIHYMRSYSAEWGSAVVRVCGTNRSWQMKARNTAAHESQLVNLRIPLPTVHTPCNITFANDRGGKFKLAAIHYLFKCH